MDPGFFARFGLFVAPGFLDEATCSRVRAAMDEAQQPPLTGRHTTSFLRRGVTPPAKETGGYTRRPSGFFLHNNAPAAGNEPPMPPVVGTSRIRCTVTGSYVPSPLAGGQNPPTGNHPPRPAATGGGNTRAVACAHCRKVFMVASRPDAYTAVCVHCGQLNRIDPL